MSGSDQDRFQPGNPDEGWGDQGDTQLLTERRQKTKKPSMYRVVMLNDDYTPMDFVVWVLQKIFHKGMEDATRLMLEVHHKGKSVVGIFTHDVARTKVQQVHNMAEQNEHPLQCVMEVEDGDEE
ncbi:MAG: ATP-dependent Clp protease adapter ClpS [Leptospirales bacterium]|jgi:ATP-dependent Clp protease adaptor protein ClpS